MPRGGGAALLCAHVNWPAAHAPTHTCVIWPRPDTPRGPDAQQQQHPISRSFRDSSRAGGWHGMRWGAADCRTCGACGACALRPCAVAATQVLGTLQAPAAPCLA